MYHATPVIIYNLKYHGVVFRPFFFCFCGCYSFMRRKKMGSQQVGVVGACVGELNIAVTCSSCYYSRTIVGHARLVLLVVVSLPRPS